MAIAELEDATGFWLRLIPELSVGEALEFKIMERNDKARSQVFGTLI